MGGEPIPLPKLCPECGAELVRDGAYLLCPNEDCQAKIKAEICYFVSRQCMDIRGIADAMINALVDNGKLHTPADLYKLTKADLMIPGISKDLKAESVLAEIERSKQKPFDRVLCAVGIDGIGTTGAKVVAKHFGNMLTLLKASIPEIAVVDGFAEVTARAIFISIHSPHKAALINELSMQGLCMEQEETELFSEKLKGLSFCITGTLSQSRDAIKQLIEDHGGKFVSSISSNTSYLVAGEGGGSKRAKAEKLGIKIINEQQLKELL
jgi:DNA ligase (NAD+)